VDAGSAGAGNPADVVDAGSPADAGGSAGKAAAVDAGSAGAGDSAGFVPSGWVAAAVALVGGLIFKAGLIMPVWPEAVAAFLVGPVIVLVLTARWSRRAGWGQEQRLGIAGGTLLTYSWAAFTAHSASFVIDLISHVIYALAAIALLYRVARRMHAPEKHEPTPDAR
jgi:membrane protein implicated in regulation of membrane protease activity